MATAPIRTGCARLIGARNTDNATLEGNCAHPAVAGAPAGRVGARTFIVDDLLD